MVRTRRLLVIGALLFALAPAQPPAGVIVVLKDGQTLVATEARREGDVYSIILPSGDLLSVAAATVQEIQLVGDPKPAPLATDPIPMATSNPPPPPQPPRPATDPHWQARSGFSELNEPDWNKAEFAKPTFDPTWKPESAYDPNVDVLADSRAEFAKPTIDPTWHPTDANAGSTWTPTDAFARW